MIELALEILIPQPINEIEAGRTLLDLYRKHMPRLIPEKYDDSEPLKERYDPDDLGKVLQKWGKFCFIARCVKPSVTLQVIFIPARREPLHSVIGLWDVKAETWEDVTSLQAFLHEVCIAFQADYGVVHILTRSEFDSQLDKRSLWNLSPERAVAQRLSDARMRTTAEKEGVARVLRGMTVAQHHRAKLRRCLPDLCRLTVFGRPYIELLGRDVLLSTPAYAVHELKSGAISVQVTPTLDDSCEDWMKFEQARDQCKHHLGMKVFCTEPDESERIYNAPYFPFSQKLFRETSKR